MLGAWVTHEFFGVPWLLAFISLPLIFVLSVICTNSMALTSWTPTGALSKITQFTMGAIDRTNPASNLIPAGMTAEIAANAANLLSDIKPGYMLGGKPRQQAIGHVIGIFAGAIACVPLFFLLFLQPDANGVRSVVDDGLRQFRVSGRAAVEGRGGADRQGLQRAAYSAVVSMIVAAVAAAAIEIARMRHQGPLSAVGRLDRPGRGAAARVDLRDVGRRDDLLGDGPQATRRRAPRGHEFWVEGMEPICAGLISGVGADGHRQRDSKCVDELVRITNSSDTVCANVDVIPAQAGIQVLCCVPQPPTTWARPPPGRRGLWLVVSTYFR